MEPPQRSTCFESVDRSVAAAVRQRIRRLARLGSLVVFVMVVASGPMGCRTGELGCNPEESGCASMEIQPVTPTPAVDSNGNVLEGMVLIPGGTFEMGIAEEDLPGLAEMGESVPHMSELHAMWWFGDEIPRHTVDVDAFYLDTHELTNGQFARFVEETGYEPQGNWQEYATEGRTDHPVIQVSWNDATACCEWAGKRLPTEAEWEYAARGGQDVQWFPWGDSPDVTCANYNWRADENIITGIPRLLGWVTIRTRPGGCYTPNGFGLYDMCGNVSEWCANERTPYPGGPEEDWIYTQYGPFREDEEPFYGMAARGGSWDEPNAVFVRITYRAGWDADTSYYWLGFRCAKSIE